MRCLLQSRERVFVKDYGFLSFSKFMGKNLINKYSRKLLDHAKKSASDVSKTASKNQFKR